MDDEQAENVEERQRDRIEDVDARRHDPMMELDVRVKAEHRDRAAGLDDRAGPVARGHSYVE